MPLQYQDQVSLLKDILTNHQTDCCGSVSEYEQLERLIKSLMVNSNISQEVKPVLEQIYSYSQGGINSSSVDHHIESNVESIYSFLLNAIYLYAIEWN